MNISSSSGVQAALQVVQNASNVSTQVIKKALDTETAAVKTVVQTVADVAPLLAVGTVGSLVNTFA
jgi:hypothetical protein